MKRRTPKSVRTGGVVRPGSKPDPRKGKFATAHPRRKPGSKGR
jgi:hypothetical protein